MEISKEQLNELYKKLPLEKRSTEFSEKASAAIRAVASARSLAPDKVSSFASVVWKTIIGAIPREKLAEQLVAEVGLTQEQARAVAGDIEREIFQNIPRLPSGDTPLKGGMGTPQSSPLEGSTRAERGGGMSVTPKAEDVSPAEKPPLPTPPRPVPIRKIAPPPPNLPTAPLPNLQTLLADIRRGTAFDEARIADAYRKTPIEIRQSLESIGFLSRLQGVARKFGLNVEETGELVSETGLVLLGLTKPPQFIDNLAKRLRLPRDRAFAVGQAVNMEVLRPVREIIRKMNDGTEEKQNTNEGFKFAPSVPIPQPSAPPKNLPTTNHQPPTTSYTSDPYREPLE